jgi:hypothetical protein
MGYAGSLMQPPLPKLLTIKLAMLLVGRKGPRNLGVLKID